MTQPDGQLEQQLAYLATDLLGWSFDPLHKTFTVIERGAMGRANLSYILTGNGMLEIIETMRTKGHKLWIKYINGEQMYPVFDRFDWRRGVDYSFMLPEAVARAAYAALQESAK